MQRREILMGDPTPAQQEAHRTALKRLLRMTRMMCAAVADPDDPDRQMADELEGRLIQLEESWRMINNPMSEAEADGLIQKFFPG